MIWLHTSCLKTCHRFYSSAPHRDLFKLRLIKEELCSNLLEGGIIFKTWTFFFFLFDLDLTNCWGWGGLSGKKELYKTKNLALEIYLSYTHLGTWGRGHDPHCTKEQMTQLWVLHGESGPAYDLEMTCLWWEGKGVVEKETMFYSPVSSKGNFTPSTC